MNLIKENITFKVADRSSVTDVSNLGCILARLNKSSEDRLSNDARIDILGRFSRKDSDLCKSIAIIALANNNPIGVAFASYYGISKIVDYQILRCLPKYRGLGIIEALNKELEDETTRIIGDAKVKGKIYRGIYKSTIEKDGINEESYDNSKFSKLRVIISEDEKLRLELNPEKKFVDSIFNAYTGFKTNFFIEKEFESSINEYLILSFLSDIITFDCISKPDEKAVICSLFTSIRKSIEL